MKILFVIVCLFVSGCATGVDQSMLGGQSKNSSVIPLERLGAMTIEDISTNRQCGDKQVAMCTTGDRRESCQCLNVHEAGDRVRQVVRQHRGPGF